MFGISYGELFLLIGATAALIGPKDLPVVARTAGRLAGRAIGYVQVARGQFESVMQQSQAQKVHKELKDALEQLDAIRHEIRSISIISPGSLTGRLGEKVDHTSTVDVDNSPPKTDDNRNYRREDTATTKMNSFQDCSSLISASSDIHGRAMAYAKLAESASSNSESRSNEILRQLTDESGKLVVLPVSAESAGLLPSRKDEAKGSDIALEAILEAEVARNAKEFFAQPQNLLKSE